MSVIAFVGPVHPRNREELELLPQLLELLKKNRWLRSDSLVQTEFSWNGRRVDLAVLSRSGIASAFELKLGSFNRCLEQAMYNRLSFDRSWIVVPDVPLASNLDLAREHGIGVILVSDQARVLAAPLLQRNPATIRAKLRRALLKRGANA